MKCSICGIQIDLVEDAIERGWISSFYDEMDNEHEFACSDCVQLFLTTGVDGEWDVKEEFREKLTYLDEGRTQAPQNDLVIGILVREEESAKLN